MLEKSIARRIDSKIGDRLINREIIPWMIKVREKSINILKPNKK